MSPAAQPAPARSIADIFPLRDDVERGRAMDEAWRAFAREKGGVVAAALGSGRSPPQVAYALGEAVHGFFRPRGVTLTSFELRRLVAELLAAAPVAPVAPVAPAAPVASPAALPEPAPAAEAALVSFDGPTDRASAWTGSEPVLRGGTPRPEEILSPPPAPSLAPPSPLVHEAVHDPDAGLLARLAGEARRRLGRDPLAAPRSAVVAAIAAALDGPGSAAPGASDQRRALAARLLSELVGLGPLDALWADPSVRSITVNGCESLQVERNGALEAVAAGFRDPAHLEEIVRRLVGGSAGPVVTLDLRDGGEAVVLRPPVAPGGPVVMLRRGEPGEATLERLVAGGRLARPMAELLRLAVRSRLTVALSGPGRSGKTALLAALARDSADLRTVTVARHRAFRWPSARKIELFLPPDAAASGVLAAALRLHPDLLVVDTGHAGDAAALGHHLASGLRGLIAAGEAPAMTLLPRERVDLVVRLAPRDGSFVVAAMEDATGATLFAANGDGGFRCGGVVPSFAGSVAQAGFAEDLARALR